MADSVPPEAAEYSKANSAPFPWSVVIIIFAVQLSFTLTPQGLPVLYPFIQSEFALSRAQIGLITSFLVGSGIATTLLGGWLVDVFGVKRVLAAVLAIMAVLVLLFPVVSSYVTLLVILGLIGLSLGPTFPATTKAMMDWLPNRVRGVAMSLKQTAGPMMGAVSALVLPALALAVGWRMAAAAIGALILATVTVFMFIYHDSPNSGRAATAFKLPALRVIWSDRPMVMITVWGVVFIGLQMVLLSYILLFFIDSIGVSPVVAGGLLAAAQISSIFARIAWGAVSDFIVKSRILVLVIIGFLVAGGFTGMSFVTPGSPWSVMFLLAVILGASSLSWHAVFIVLLGEKADPRQLGMTAGAIDTVQRIGMIAMPPLFGYLADATGTYAAGWRAAAAVALICTLALLAFGREPQHQRLSMTQETSDK